MERVLAVLRRFRDEFGGEQAERRSRLYRLSRASMELFEGNSYDECAKKIVKADLFGLGRLHALANLRFFAANSLILVEHIVGDFPDGNALEMVASNFAGGEISAVMETAARHSRDVDGILAAMLRCDIFSGSLDASKIAEKWTEQRVWDLILLLHEKTGVNIPTAVTPLRARVATAEAFHRFSRGQVELSDFFNIVASVCDDDGELFDELHRYVMGLSVPLGKLFSDRRTHIAFVEGEAADVSEPV